MTDYPSTRFAVDLRCIHHVSGCVQNAQADANQSGEGSDIPHITGIMYGERKPDPPPISSVMCGYEPSRVSCTLGYV